MTLKEYNVINNKNAGNNNALIERQLDYLKRDCYTEF